MAIIRYGAGKITAQITQETDKDGKKITASKPLPKKGK